MDAIEDPGGWKATIQAPSEHGALELTFGGADVAGNPATGSAELQVDATPPTVKEVTVQGGVSSGDIVWVAQPTATVTVDAADVGSGLNQICVGEQCVPAASKTLFVPLEPGTLEVTLVVSDQVGNETPHPLALGRDESAPTCTILAPEQGHWYSDSTVELSIESEDAGVGGVVVKANGVTAVEEDGLWVVELTLPEGQTNVNVTCTDALDNDEDTDADIHVDLTPPELLLGASTFSDESEAGVSWDGDLVSYGLDNAQITTIGPTTCPDFQCEGPWRKLSSRLTYDPEPPWVNLNLPSLVFTTEDAGAVTLTYHAERDGVALTAEAAVPEIEGMRQVPIAVQFLTDEDPATFQWTDAAVPSAIVVTATDQAGWVTSHTWHFDLELYAPPVFLEEIPSWTAQAHDASSFELLTTVVVPNDIAQPFAEHPAVGTNGGLRVARYVATNPHPVPVAVHLGNVLAKASWTAQRIFVPQSSANTPCVGDTCGLGLCSFSSGGGCQSTPAPVDKQSATTLTASAIAYPLSELDVAFPQPLPLAPPIGLATIPAGEQAILDVLVQSTGTCVIGAGTIFTNGSGDKVRVHVDGAECGEAGPSANDTASCSKSGPSFPPFNGCKVVNHDAPLGLTSFRLDSFGPQLQIKHHVPNVTGPATFALHPIEFSYETIVSGLPLAP